MKHWTEHFDDRQLGLIRNCKGYAQSEPSGLPGHQLMLIVAKLAELLQKEQDQPQAPHEPIHNW